MKIYYILKSEMSLKGQLAQLVERLVYTEVVGSSSLSLPMFYGSHDIISTQPSRLQL